MLLKNIEQMYIPFLTAVLCCYCHLLNYILSLKALKGKLSLLTIESSREGRGPTEDEEKESKPTVTIVEESLDGIITLCHRSSQNVDQLQREVISVCVCMSH